MKFIKRLVFVILLLLLAFFVYRLVSPTNAKALIQDVKIFSNDTLGTHFALTTEPEEIVIETGIILEQTGTLVDEIDVLQEFGDEDLLLLGDELIEETIPETIPESTPELIPTTKPIIPSKPPVKPKPKSNPSWSEDDLKLLDNFSVN